MTYRPEPPLIPDSPEDKTAVLLVNLGTPAAPTTAAVRRYLREFLSDPRVVEIPRIVWAAILHGVILRVRPRRSAAKYAQIWMPEGSPLAVHTARQAVLLRGLLGERCGKPVRVEYAMRYGEPSLAATLARLHADACRRILVVPLYPQYAASTTASVMDAVFAFMAGTRNIPELRFVRHFHDDPGYIDALAQRVLAHWAAHGRPDKLLMSFHGLPRYTVDRGDPYYHECLKTAQLLAERLALPMHMWTVSFQSRFGRARWLEPYTTDVLATLARSGTGRVDIVAPGFAADCLETIEELGIEGRRLFLDAGGRACEIIPCLNEEPAWIEALAGIVMRECGAWLPRTSS